MTLANVTEQIALDRAEWNARIHTCNPIQGGINPVEEKEELRIK